MNCAIENIINITSSTNSTNDNIDEIIIEKNCKVLNSKKSLCPNKYDEYFIKNFNSKLGKYTFGLDKIIPWEESNFVFSGGLLFDIIRDRFSQDLMDIDLFFYGSMKSKIATINKLLDNLDKNQYYYLIGHNRSVIYIFVQGIPRMIQLIMSNKQDPESIINEFDLSHVKSYTDGKKVYCSKSALEYFNAQTKLEEAKAIEIKAFRKNRIIKYIERGIMNMNLIMNKYNFVLNDFDSNKYIKSKKQIKLYKLTYNLTRYFDGETIDFKNFNSNKFRFVDYFGCVVNYNKLDNHEFVEGVDMFGAFSQYMCDVIVNEKSVLDDCKVSILDIDKESNDIAGFDEKTNSDQYINLDNYELVRLDYNSYCKIFSILNERSIYIPCHFIESNIIETDLNENKVLTLKFFIDNISVIDYLKTKLNKYIILDKLDNKAISYKLVESKYKMDKNKIYLPFDESNDLNVPDNLVINAKLYNKGIDEFYNTNPFGILDNLEPNTLINCLFDIIIFVSLKNDNNGDRNIEYIDINLEPKYIHKYD